MITFWWVLHTLFSILIVLACKSSLLGMEQANITCNLCTHSSWMTALPIQRSPVGVTSAVSGAGLVVDPPYIRRLAVGCVRLSVPSNGSLDTRIPATLTRACITFTNTHTHTLCSPFSHVSPLSWESPWPSFTTMPKVIALKRKFLLEVSEWSQSYVPLLFHSLPTLYWTRGSLSSAGENYACAH